MDSVIGYRAASNALSFCSVSRKRSRLFLLSGSSCGLTIIRSIPVRPRTARLTLVNSVIRKATTRHKMFPNDEAALKVVYLAIESASKKVDYAD